MTLYNGITPLKSFFVYHKRNLALTDFRTGKLVLYPYRRWLTISCTLIISIWTDFFKRLVDFTHNFFDFFRKQVIRNGFVFCDPKEHYQDTSFRKYNRRFVKNKGAQKRHYKKKNVFDLFCVVVKKTLSKRLFFHDTLDFCLFRRLRGR